MLRDRWLFWELDLQSSRGVKVAAAPLIEGSRSVRMDPPLGKCQWGCNTDQDVWLGVPVHGSPVGLYRLTRSLKSHETMHLLCDCAGKFTALSPVAGRVSRGNSWMDRTPQVSSRKEGV